MPIWNRTQLFARSKPLQRNPLQRNPLQHRHCLASVIASGVLCLGGAGFVVECLLPSVVHAYPGRADILLDVQPGETYDVLLRRAEAIARAAAQRTFDRDLLVTQVSVTIVAQNQRGAVPVLTLQVDRTGWRNRPDSRRWATYYSTSRKLLGMDTAPVTPAVGAAPVISTPGATTSRNPATPASASSPPASGAASGAATPTPTSRPFGQPILPERILTPGDIGK
jgi:hypothetical protein